MFLPSLFWILHPPVPRLQYILESAQGKATLLPRVHHPFLGRHGDQSIHHRPRLTGRRPRQAAPFRFGQRRR